MIRIFAILALICLSAPAFAQYDFDLTSGNDHQKLIKKIIVQDPKADFNYLRQLYTNMPFYEPDGQILLQTLREQAALINNLPPDAPPHGVTKALNQYNDLISNHIAHPVISAEAARLADKNPSLGDPRLYNWIYKSLKHEIMRSGDGNSPETAFHIITWEEEDIIFNTLKVASLESEDLKQGFAWYRAHNVIHEPSGKNYVLFIDITKPQEKHLQREKNRPQSLDFTRFNK